jgi:two-component system sensor histidine kinase DegS
MDRGADGDRRRARFEAIYEEAKQALGYSANQLRALTERARELHAETTAEWQRQRGGPEATRPAATAAVGPDELGRQRQEVERLDVAVKSLESSWLFLERGSDGIAEQPPGDDLPADLRMRVLEAQEAERSRLAQEIHDGPAQTLANAIFLAELVERQLESDPVAARAELRALRELVDRELGEIRGFINQLRPDLDAIGLEAALREAAEQAEQGPLEVEVDLRAPADLLGPTQQAAVLRIAQEGLRNVRKHAEARRARLVTRLQPGPSADDPPDWVLEVWDDGHGFDAEASRPLGRSFGLRFMRQRAELIGARIEILSAATTGTTVRLTISGAQRR